MNLTNSQPGFYEEMTSPLLQLKIIYGLKTNIIGNGHFITDNDVLYPVGNTLAIHNFAERKQKLLQLPSNEKEINIITVSPNKKFVAICEVGDKPTITIYDVHTLKKKKILVIPYDLPGVKSFVCISFTFDSRYLVAITNEPDQMLLYYSWEKGKIESTMKITNVQNNSSKVKLLSCNPEDCGIVAIAGRYYLKFLIVSETVWRTYGFSKGENLIITGITWLNVDRLLAGTVDSRLIYFENGELKNIYNGLEINMINFKLRDDNNQATVVSQINLDDVDDMESDKNEKQIRCLISFSKGFAFNCGLKNVIFFERDGQYKYYKKHIFYVPNQLIDTDIDVKNYNNLYKINTINVNISQDCLLVTTGWPQIFSAKLFNVDNIDNVILPRSLEIMGYKLHYGKISKISMCSWKSIFMTYGESDKSVRIWDYNNDKLIMMKQYKEDIYCISLHPIGLYCLIGFKDKLKLLTIVIDNLLLIHDFSIHNCKIVNFSNGGHLFAAVNGNVIQIYSTISLLKKYLLKGHIGIINKILWSKNDMKLITSGNEGIIYIWDMNNGNRISEIIFKNIILNDLTLLTTKEDSSSNLIYAIGNDNKLKEIKDDNVTREFELNNINMELLLISQDDPQLFLITCSNGKILLLKYPLQEPIQYKLFHIHSTNISDIILSYNEQNLITSDNDGNLCFWKIISNDKTIDSLNLINTNEILINEYELMDNINKINDLEIRMKEIENENLYKLRKNDLDCNNKIRDLHQGYTATINELKLIINNLQQEKTNELNILNEQLNNMKIQYEEFNKNLEEKFTEKLIIESDKYRKLQDYSYNLQKNCDKVVNDLKEEHLNELNELKHSYEAQIHEKINEINKLNNELTNEVNVHENIKKQMELDTDREIIELKTNYESQLFNCKQEILKLTGEAGVFKNKYLSFQKEIDNYILQLNLSKNQDKHYKKVIQDLEHDIIDLKNEINERDMTIKQKEFCICDIQKNNMELEKCKSVLSHKVDDLIAQLTPKDEEIIKLNEQIYEQMNKLNNINQTNDSLTIELKNSNEKFYAIKIELTKEMSKNRRYKTILNNIRHDLAMTINLIQNPQALKKSVTDLYYRYNNEKYLDGIAEPNLDIK